MITVAVEARAGFPPSVALMANDVTVSVISCFLRISEVAVISPVSRLMLQKPSEFPKQNENLRVQMNSDLLEHNHFSNHCYINFKIFN